MSDETQAEDGQDERADVLTRFKTGNFAWRARSTHGRHPKFADPAALLDACEQYFEFVESTPMMAAEAVKFQGDGRLMLVPKLRAPTLRGLCAYIGISRSTWSEYRVKPDFSHTCEWAEDALYQHKVEAAAAGMMDAGFIGRELGLADKKEHTGDMKVTGLTFIASDD